MIDRDDPLRNFVRSRARFRCEYCRISEALSIDLFHVDHIRAIQHRGVTQPENLALACKDCNGYKGPNIGGYYRDESTILRLFHPRKDSWHKHFAIHGGSIVHKSRIGWVTMELLRFNDPQRVSIRRAMLELGHRFNE